MNKPLFTTSMIAADSHQGLVRQENQDSFAYSISDDGSMAFLLVADGIGGNERGDLASRFVCELMLRDFRRFQQEGARDIEAIKEFLRSTIILTNSALRNTNQSYNIAHPMGSTVVSAILIDGYIITAHAGDSRIYCLKDGELKRYTEDHSFINEMIKRGKLTQEEAERHPYAHVIIQSMGVMDMVTPDVNVYERTEQDRFLVCTDGVMLHVKDNTIRDVLTKAEDARDAVRELISLALRGGGGDNVTAMCFIQK